MAKKERFRIVLPLAVASWAYLAEPDAGPPMKNGKKSEPKYKITLLFDQDTDFAPLDAKIVAAIRAEWGGKIKPSIVQTCLKDGDLLNATREDNGKDAVESWVGKKIINASSKFQPDVVDAKKVKLEPGMVRSGDGVRAMIELIPCEPNGKKTIGVRLLAVQLIEKNNTGGEGWGNAFDEAEGYSAEDGIDARTGQADDDNGDF